MSDLDAWLYSAPAGDGPTEDPNPASWAPRWVLHGVEEDARDIDITPAESLFRPYGWWRGAP